MKGILGGAGGVLAGVVVRYGLAAAGGVLVARGLIGQETVDQLISVAAQAVGGEIGTVEQAAGALGLFIATAWSVGRTWLARRAAAAATPAAAGPTSGGAT